MTLPPFLRCLALNFALGGIIVAAPTTSPDTYGVTEDQSFTASSGPIFEESFDGGDGGGGEISFDGPWSYLDRIENANGASHTYPTDSEGRDWRSSLFETASSSVTGWATGQTPLQAGGIEGFPGAPEVLFGLGAAGNGENLITTYLFRNTFTLTAAEAAMTSWQATFLADDGAVIYINGTEVHRTATMPAGSITTETFADNAGLNETDYLTEALDLTGLLVAGTNVVAVEVHQTTATSSDAGFDLDLSVSSGGGAIDFVDDPFPAPYASSAPDFAAGDIEDGGGFSGAGAHIRIGGGPRFQNTVSGGAWRVPVNLSNAATVDVSFRYRLVADAGYEPSEENLILFAVDGALVGRGGSVFIEQIIGDGNGGGDDDTGWLSFSTQLPLTAGAHTFDFGAHNTGSSTPSEFADAYFDDVSITFVGGGTGGSVLANDSGDSATLLAALDSPPANGAVTLNPDGTFTYLPDANFSGTDTFTYIATDNTGSSGATTVTVEVAAVNDPPVVNDRNATIDEDTVLSPPVAFGLQLNASDVENEPLTFSAASQPANGTLTVNANGSFTYTPDTDFAGTDSFTYTASDGADTSQPATLTIEVTEVNDPPSAVADTYTTGENIPLTVSQSGAPSPIGVAADSFSAAAGVAFTGVTNIEPSGAFASLSGFDGGFLRNRTSGDPADATTITLNDLPTHDQISIGFVLAVIDSWDGDAGDVFNVTIDGQTVFSTAFENSGQGGTQTYAPPAGGELARRVDLGFGSRTEDLDSAYDLAVEPALQNIAHTASSATIRIFASGSDWSGGDDESWAIDDFQVSVLDSGVSEIISQGSVWRYLDDGSDQGTAWRSTGFNDSAWASGPAELGYGDDDEATVVSFGGDDNNKFATTYFRRTFTVDNPGSFESVTLGLRRDDGGAVYINGTEVARSNLDPGAAFDEFAQNNAGSETDFYEFAVDAAQLVAGTNTIAVEIHQDDGNSSDISFDLWLRGQRARNFGVVENDSDIDSANLAATVLSPPASGAVDLAADGSFTYTPGLNYEGTDSFSYTLSDGEFSDTATVTITVTPGPNDLPVTTANSYTAIEDIPISIGSIFGLLSNDSDPEGATLTALLDSAPVNGSVDLQPDGAFTYTPNANFNGADPFTYRANDGIGVSPPQTVAITVSARNDIPVAVGDTYLMAPSSTLAIQAPGVLENDSDIDGDSLTSTLTSQTEVGTALLSTNGFLFYSPPAGFSGQTSFTYTAGDGQISSAPATVTINVNAAPAAVPNTYTVVEDTPLNIISAFGVLSNDSDPENDPLRAALVTPPAHGTLNLTPDGGFQFTPEANYTGADSFAYLANDGLQDSPPTTVSLTVTAVDDPPVAVADEYFVLIDQSVAVTAADGLLANDADVENDPMTAIEVTQPAHGTLTLSDDGSFIYVPDAGFSGLDSFTYKASANGSDSADATVDLYIGAAADSIVINELMFHPASDNDAEEFIELHNLGSGPVPLAGWRFTSGVTFDFPDMTIAAGSFVVIAADPATFEATYGVGRHGDRPMDGATQQYRREGPHRRQHRHRGRRYHLFRSGRLGAPPSRDSWG